MAVAFLVEHGHRKDEVIDYTLEEINLFVRLHDKSDRQNLVHQAHGAALASNAGFSGNMDALKKYSDALLGKQGVGNAELNRLVQTLRQSKKVKMTDGD